ncbi:MAG: Hpt domain-containing protein [Gammaproteobacteria bacterium]|nr:Hpt domain-containing protein [Gammaproteobacteria bacterium]
MKTEDTVEYNSLRWVKKELDLILNEAQSSLSVYIEDTDEVDRLRECIEHLHMVQGTLQMVELYGAAQLAEEMEQVATAVLNGALEKTDDAYDVLMRSMLQLPDYLESLQAGNKDVPMVLLPLLNDLRASRSANLLSENVLFFPDIEASDDQAESVEVAAGQLQALAKKLRPHYQIGLLGWFKGQKIRASLKRILAVLTELEKKSATNSISRLWSVSAALTEGLANEGIDSSVSIKMLLGQVDRAVKQLIDQGEESFAKNIPEELLKNLLYYIARVEKESPRVNKAKETYRLQELLPADSELEEARSGLGGLNTELLRTVSQGIREDLLEVKDVIEIFVHSESHNPERLSGLPELLNKIADTLAMLGLGGPRENVLEQCDKIKQLVDGSIEAVDDEVMNVASVLLNVESQLNNFIASRSGIVDDIEGQKRRVGDLGEMPEAEYLEVLSAVIREALQDFSDARQAILGYLENNTDKELLDIILKRLDEVSGAMFMLPIQKLEPQIAALHDYVAKVLRNAGQVPDQQTQDDMADVVTSVEYYLEAILEGRPDLELSLSTGEAAAQRLNKVSSKFEDVAEPLPSEEKLAEVKAEVVEEKKPAKEKAAEKTAATESTDVEQRYVILGDDADEEILEIFIEEALEELASLNEQIPVWANNHQDEEALTTIRRSFHTLKGSGRLIGAELIGEFSWGFENMLNRIIDKSRPLNQEVFDALDEALGVLPQLIEQLKGNREPIPNVYELIDRVESLGKWQKSDATTKGADLETDTKNESGSEQEELTESIELEITEPEPEIVQQDVQLIVEEKNPVDEIDAADDLPDLSEEISESDIDDEFDIDLTEDLEALQLAISPEDEDAGEEEILLEIEEEPVVEAEETEAFEIEEDASATQLDIEETEDFNAEDALEIHIDPVLFKIFKGESESHLQNIRDLLDKHYQGVEALSANQELIRALHTLFGSARTANVDEIAELCGALEKYVKLYQEFDDLVIHEDGVKVIDDVSAKVSLMLEALADPEKRLHSDQVLLDRINSLSANLQKQVNAAVIEPVTPPLEDLQSQVEPEQDQVQLSDSESLVSYSDVDDELVDIFLEEAEELLDSCENSLQRWSNNNADVESVNDLQRHLHTLKGGARMADLAPIGNLTHALESLIISANEGRISFSRDMSNALHDSMDRLSDMLARVKSRDPISSAEDLINNIELLRHGKDINTKPAADDVSAGEDEEPEPESFPEESFEIEEINTGNDQDEAYSLEFDESIIVDDANDVSDSVELVFEGAPDETDFKTEIAAPSDLEKSIPEKPIPEKSSFVLPKEEAGSTEEPAQKGGIAHEQVRVRSDLLNELVNSAGEVSVYHARMGQQMSDFSFNLSEMDQTVIRLREQLRKLSIETEAQILSRYEKESDQYDEDFDPLEMDRFSTMQQISRSLQETVADIDSIKNILAEDVRDAETLLLQESRVSTELQEGLMRTRMVHFGGLASRLRRIVRQTAREISKDVELEITGETSEVDRTVLDRIVAPLEHMLRNAVSHGIELPEDRVAAGKSETGNISIGVDREGGDVVIKVVDDGRGIDVSAVRKRASEQGLLEHDSNLSDHDVLQFIMQPGFSTAEKVTQISGRGVGMDVVDSEIKQLGGVLEIDTLPGKGTTFTIRLPLTLAINHALLVNSGEDIYAVPLNSIEGVVRLSGPELQQFYNSEDNSYEFAGTHYELKHLGYLLTGQQPDYSRSGQLFPVLLAHVGDQRVALHVDDLLGRREIVVKPVGPQISTVRGISGATILGDGRVVLILEMNALVLGESLFHVSAEAAEQPAIAIEAAPKEERETVVMVVDDSITIRKVTERMLSRHNIKVITAKDGVDAVAQLQEQIPDVMLLDIEMPRMDGYEVATHVRNDERLKNLPIIMITSRSGAKHREKAMEIGVNKYLGKPYQEDDLMENIRELIDV